MNRRKQESLLKLIADLASQVHWGVGVALAIVSYVAFHLAAARSPIVSSPTAPTASPGPGGAVAAVGAHVPSMLVGTIAWLFQYIVPITILLGAAVSAFRRRSEARVGLLARAGSDAIRFVSQLHWKDFERLLADYFRTKGYAVEEIGGGGPDGGVDLALRKGTELTLVQCKHWRARAVPVGVVRELYGVMAARGAAHGVVVSSGSATPDAWGFASGRNIELLVGDKLVSALERAQGQAPGRTADRASSPAKLAPPSPPAAASMATAVPPACPKCGSAMLERVAQKPPYVGTKFWGCSTFPRCKTIVPIS